MRERWDELLSLLVADCSSKSAALWANEIARAVEAKDADNARLRATLAVREAQLRRALPLVRGDYTGGYDATMSACDVLAAEIAAALGKETDNG